MPAIVDTPAPGSLVLPGHLLQNLLSPALWAVVKALLPTLTGTKATLRFNVTDNLAAKVKVKIFVYNELGQLQTALDAPGQYAGGYRDSGGGSVTWDGAIAAGGGALPGLYNYRVAAVDEAGNTAVSTDSAQFLVVLPKLPVLGGILGLLG